MRLTVLTANLPRHIALLDRLADAGHEVTAVIEPKTPPEVAEPVQREYWERVIQAERRIFGVPLLQHPAMIVARGTVTRRDVEWDWSEHEIVFSSSYLRGSLADRLISRGAWNLHVGIAPEYRGSAPNMWAHYDGHNHLIGAQVQRLSAALDAGEILAERRAPPDDDGYFMQGMRAVALGIEAVVELLQVPGPWRPVRANDRAQQIRYSRHADFTEEIAAEILGRNP